MALEPDSTFNCAAIMVIVTDDPYTATAETNSVARILFDATTARITVVPDNACNEVLTFIQNLRPDQQWRFASVVIVGDEQQINFDCFDPTGSPNPVPGTDTIFISVYDIDPPDSIGPMTVTII